MYKTVTLPILIYAFNEKADGTSNFLPGFEGLRPVRVFRTTETPEFWKSVGGAGRTEFNAVVQLLQAINSGDRLAAKNASVQLAKTKSSELGKLVSEVAAKFESYPQTQLDEAISERLKSARLVLWSSRGKPVPAIFCPDNLAGIWRSVPSAVLPLCRNVRTKNTAQYDIARLTALLDGEPARPPRKRREESRWLFIREKTLGILTS
jgi:hypothetical protein